MEEIIIEIRDFEGGEDSKLLVNEMVNIYIKWCNLNSKKYKILESKNGFTSFSVTGNGVKSFFDKEIGTHCWHRVSPTEKRGRIHTSTVAVSVMGKEIFSKKEIDINPKDVEVQYTRSGGKGGQNVNKRSTCVILKHIPSGIIIRSEENRTQGKNEDAAWTRLRSILQNGANGEHVDVMRKSRYNPNSSSQIKRRTYKVKDSIVTDHVSGKKENLTNILKGKIELVQ
jgi:peptide chain release factor 1